jgi:hypothetical protein
MSFRLGEDGDKAGEFENEGFVGQKILSGKTLTIWQKWILSGKTMGRFFFHIQKHVPVMDGLS